MSKEKTFKEQYERLEEIVSELSKDTKDIDESITLFKEGIELYKNCNAKLSEAQEKVIKLTKDGLEEEFENLDGK